MRLPLIAADQQAEEEAGLFPRGGQATEFIQDQQTGVRELLQGAVEAVLMPGAHQATHETLQCQKQHE
jgi:hypothetical protein